MYIETGYIRVFRNVKIKCKEFRKICGILKGNILANFRSVDLYVPRW
jgi:hypothetical protein